MGPIGIQEMIVIFVLALLLFGPKKLPELGRTIGKALTEFRRASSDLKATFEREMQTLEHENESIKQATRQASTEFYNQVYDDPSIYDRTMYGSETPQAAISGPSTVSASEVPGAESEGTTQVVHPQATGSTPAVEGTVARSEAPRTGTATEVAEHAEKQPLPETPQHS